MSSFLPPQHQPGTGHAVTKQALHCASYVAKTVVSDPRGPKVPGLAGDLNPEGGVYCPTANRREGWGGRKRAEILGAAEPSSSRKTLSRENTSVETRRGWARGHMAQLGGSLRPEGAARDQGLEGNTEAHAGLSAVAMAAAPDPGSL
jgi:hypothetical protein